MKTTTYARLLRPAAIAGLTAAILWLPAIGAQGARAADTYTTVASPTATDNAGLFSHLLPMFEQLTGIQVRVVAVGTGQAIRLARNGDADVLLVHHKPSEQKFIEQGFGVKRFDVMYNDFVLLGPATDPAGIKGGSDTPAALARIAAKRAAFASRGDDSGTHKKELGLWRAAGVDPVKHSGGWYRETGRGMGATLNTAVGMDAYVLSDRATWITFQNTRRHMIVVEGDKKLFNQYGVILVNPKKHPHVKAKAGQKFIDWLLSADGQRAIAAYKRGGQQLFFPNAGGTS